MPSLDRVARDKLAELDASRLRRVLVPTRRGPGALVRRQGRRLISFCCNDYLGLSHHPSVTRAAARAVRAFGTGAGGSRLLAGNHPLYQELEERLARLHGSEAACVFGSGYLTSLGTIPALIGPGDLFLVDELSHACLIAGGRQSRAEQLRYRHADVSDCERLLEKERSRHRRCLIATDGVFSMDGDRGPVGELAALARRHDAWLLVDDAHGLGVLAEDARPEAGSVDLQLGTLSKALGGYGGFVCASRAVVDLLVNRARTLVYSTGLPPATLAGAVAALDVIDADPALRRRPLERARLFARELELPVPASPIVPLIVGDPGAAVEASERLAEQGFLVVAIRPPTVPPGTSRLRVSFAAHHTETDVQSLARAVARIVLGATA
jgi:8-amino-7-oxononanoate synthase